MQFSCILAKSAQSKGWNSRTKPPEWFMAPMQMLLERKRGLVMRRPCGALAPRQNCGGWFAATRLKNEPEVGL
jgi:hypothetical protein